MSRFRGRVVVVTGAGSGIGRATAQRFASEGATVVVADRDTAGAEASVRAIIGAGHHALVRVVDVSDEAQIAGLMHGVAEECGRIDVLHNNAAAMGATGDGDIADLDVGAWDAKMAVNVRGAMLGCKHVAPIMRAAGGGAIVNTASVSGLLGTDTNAAYGASKAAVIGLTRYVATMLGPDGIRCNAVAPGLTLTERLLATLTPSQLDAYRAERLLPWAATPEDIAGVVAWLASDEARAITGQTIVVDSGTTAHRPRHAMQQWDAIRAKDPLAPPPPQR